MSTPSGDRAAERPQVGLVLVGVFVMFASQMLLNPLIAPLAREVGLAEWQVGVMISTAAVVIVLTSQFWGRLSMSWGRRRVLVTATAAGSVAMAAFAVLAWLGMEAVIGGTALFVLFVLARGVGFGLAVAAAPPTAQAYIADVTTNERDRVKGMAGVGAVQGVAMVIGAVAGGLLARFGLLVPIVVAPIVVAAGSVLLAVRLRPEPRHALIADPPKVSPFDPRVWPFLVAGLGMFTALGFIQIITGFLVQDRHFPDGEVAAMYTGLALLAAGIGMVVAQSVAVPRLGWGPVRLMRVGAAIALVGFAGMIPDLSIWQLIAAVGLIGLGLGMAMPGYTAGPSLLMDPSEQGGMAGLVGANNALTFVAAPTLATVLYGISPTSPIVVSVAVMLAVLVFLTTHPRFRSVGFASTADLAKSQVDHVG